MNREHRLSLLKTVPGLAISGFFLWWTFRGFHRSDFAGVRMVAPVWLLGVLGFSLAGYTTRCLRWWLMLRSAKARFTSCARIFMTSLAANNILPLRIGDVMRIFTYAGDLNSTPSVILSTVLIEKLLDIFTLAVLFVVTLGTGAGVSPHLMLAAKAGIAVSTLALLVLVLGARVLEGPLSRFFAGVTQPQVKKAGEWLMLALECIQQIGVVGTVGLVLVSFVAWAFEGLLYVSMAKVLGLVSDAYGPWQAVAQANLSFLVPSSPGGIGVFEWACKAALLRHGVAAAPAGIFGLVIHAWLMVAITGAGGAMFLAHRLRRARRVSLKAELDTLPVELP